jgi:TetR/AcrR family acrAB operon transcriptional repressor
MAMHGAKSAYPSMLPADAFLGDLELMLRTLVAGALARATMRQPASTASAKKSKRKTPGKALANKPGKTRAKTLAKRAGKILDKTFGKKPGGRK